MKDITSIGTDLTVLNSQANKAANVLSIQIGELEYAPTFGIDLRFFLDENLQFQNESFKSYLIQRLAEHHINVNQVLEALETFYQQFTFTVGESESISGGFIR
jgi:hypothetical protein